MEAQTKYEREINQIPCREDRLLCWLGLYFCSAAFVPLGFIGIADKIFWGFWPDSNINYEVPIMIGMPLFSICLSAALLWITLKTKSYRSFVACITGLIAFAILNLLGLWFLLQESEMKPRKFSIVISNSPGFLCENFPSFPNSIWERPCPRNSIARSQ
jgi:hypothetical protein